MKRDRVYVVFNGRKPGVYFSWTDAEKEVTGYSGAVYKRYPSIDLANRAFASGDPKYQDPAGGNIDEAF